MENSKNEFNKLFSFLKEDIGIDLSKSHAFLIGKVLEVKMPFDNQERSIITKIKNVVITKGDYNPKSFAITFLKSVNVDFIGKKYILIEIETDFLFDGSVLMVSLFLIDCGDYKEHKKFQSYYLTGSKKKVDISSPEIIFY